MIDAESLRFLASLGVGGVLAGFMFWMYRKDSLAWTAAWQGQSNMLLQVVKEMTQVMTAHITKHEGMEQTVAKFTELVARLEIIVGSMRERER